MDPNGNLFLRVQQKIKKGKNREDDDGTQGLNQQVKDTPHASKSAEERRGTSSADDSVIIIPDTPSPVFSKFVGKRGKQVAGGKLLNHTSDRFDKTGTSDGSQGPSPSKARSHGSEGISYRGSRPPREPVLTPDKHSSPWKRNIFEGKNSKESVQSPKVVSSFRSKFLDAKSKSALSPGKVKISPYVPSHGIHFKTAFQEMMERKQERSKNESNYAVHNQELDARTFPHSSSRQQRKHDPSGHNDISNHGNKRSAKLNHHHSDKPSNILTIEQSKGQDSERQHNRTTACNAGQRTSEASSSSPKIKRARLDSGFHNKEFYNACNTWPSESSDSDDSDFDPISSQTLQAMLDHSCNPQTNSPVSAAPALNVTPPKGDWLKRVHRVRDGAKESVNHTVAKHACPKSPVSSLHDITSLRSSNHNPQGPQVDNESSGAHRREEKLDGNNTKNMKRMKGDQRGKMSGWFDDGFSRMAESDWSPSTSEESRSHSRKMASERSRSIQLAALESRSNKSKNTYPIPVTDQGYTPAIANHDHHGSPNQPIICEDVKESISPQNETEQVEGDEELAKKLQEQMDMEFAMSLQNLENQPPVFGAGVYPHHDMSIPSPVVAYNRGPVAVGQGRWATAQRGRATTSRYPDLDEVEALLRDLDEPEERLLQHSPQSRPITRNGVRAQSARINSSLLSMLEGGSPPMARQPRSRRRGQRRNAAPRGFDVGSPVEGNDYEDLLSLAEMLGDVKNKGLTEAQSSRLPVRVYQANSEKQESEDCLICMCEYDQDDRLKMLPCFHEFHEQCIDKWIKGNASCPVCRVEVKLT